MLILKLYFLHMSSCSLLCLKFKFVYNATHIAQEMDQSLVFLEATPISSKFCCIRITIKY